MMEWCCSCRDKKERKDDFKNLSNRNLELKLKQERSKKTRECWFGSLYASTAIGTGIATGMSGGTSSILGTIPTTILASVATYDSFSLMYDSHKNIQVIKSILDSRKEAEIVYLDNKNAITICNISDVKK